MTALTIAFVPGVSPAKWARTWRARFPHIDLVLRPVAPSGLLSELDHDADMAFARLPMPEHLRAIPLWTETAVVVIPKDALLATLDTITEADLRDATVLGDGIPDDVDALLDLVEANVGVTILPQSLFRAASRKTLTARPFTGHEGTRIALVWHDESTSEYTDAFIGIVRGRTENSSRDRNGNGNGNDAAEAHHDDPGSGDAASGAPREKSRNPRAAPARRNGTRNKARAGRRTGRDSKRRRR